MDDSVAEFRDDVVDAVAVEIVCGDVADDGNHFELVEVVLWRVNWSLG